MEAVAAVRTTAAGHTIHTPIQMPLRTQNTQHNEQHTHTHSTTNSLRTSCSLAPPRLVRNASTSSMKMMHGSSLAASVKIARMNLFASPYHLESTLLAVMLRK